MFDGKFDLARLEEALNQYATPGLDRQVDDDTALQGFTGAMEEVIVRLAGAGMNRGMRPEPSAAWYHDARSLAVHGRVCVRLGDASGFRAAQARVLHPAVLAWRFSPAAGKVWIGWLWAGVTGLAFLIVARRFRYDCRDHPAEWLAIAIAVVLFESVYPGFGPNVPER